MPVRQVVVGQNDLTKKDEEEEVFAVQATFSHVNFGEGELVIMFLWY